MQRLGLHITFILCLLPAILWGQGDWYYTLDFEALEAATISNVDKVNTANLEFSPQFYKDGIVYISIGNAEVDKNINEPFFDLFYQDLSKDVVAVKILGEVNTPYHAGPCAINEKNGDMYISQSIIKKRGQNNRMQMKLVHAVRENDYWTVLEEFAHNDTKYSIIHPTLNDNGDMLIFASNMPGGYGKMDLYSSHLVDGAWSLPKNLGPLINTEGNDWFPTLYRDDWLFFSSEFREGYGKLDILYSNMEQGVWSFPENLGTPFNSEGDDFGLIISDDGRSGYFTSSRPGGYGKDDIYRFNLSQPMIKAVEPEEEVVELADFTVKIYDKDALIPIVNAEIEFLPIQVKNRRTSSQDFDVDIVNTDEESGEVTLKLIPKIGSDKDAINLMSTDLGEVSVQLNKAKHYILSIRKEGYIPEQTVIDASNLIPEIYMLLRREKSSPTASIKIPTQKGDIVVFDNIYYDYNKYNIKPGAAAELNQLAEAMKQNKKLKIELGAHTDSRGRSAYNLSLSIQRAQSAKSYLIDRGVEASQIIAIGYGEKFIRNHCKDGVKCSEDEHLYNRRTEVRVLEN